MGTSTDYSGGRGGAWTGYKRAATSFAKHGGNDRAGRALARHVGTLGGAHSAAASATAGKRGVQQLGVFLAGVAAGGLSEGLRRLGLDDLVGSDRYEVVTALVEELGGTGGGLEEVAAQSAALDVLEELFPDDASDYGELDQLGLDDHGVRDAFERFLARYLYYRAAPVIEERLNRLDPATAAGRDAEIQQYVEALVKLRIGELDPASIDWGGASGRNTAAALLRDVYEYIEAQDQ